jgi:hypothetical protein
VFPGTMGVAVAPPQPLRSILAATITEKQAYRIDFLFIPSS